MKELVYYITMYILDIWIAFYKIDVYMIKTGSRNKIYQKSVFFISDAGVKINER